MLKGLASKLAQQMRDGRKAGAEESSGMSGREVATPRGKLKIITAFDQAFEQMGAICAKSIAHYALAHDFDYEIFRDVEIGRPPAWAKIDCLISEVQSGKYDYVLWIDADACFVRADKNILEEAPADRDISLVRHMVTRGGLEGYPQVFVQCERPNTGVLLVKATDWSLEFLQKVWAQEQYINSAWWEQAAVHELMGYWFEISGARRKNMLVEEVMAHIGWLDSIWNCVPTPADGVSGLPLVTNAANPVIVHFAGMRADLRLKEMQALAIQHLALHRN